MDLKNVVPWGRNLQEYKEMFLLKENELKSYTVLGCGDGPSSFNIESTRLYNADITSIDPIYQFSNDEIAQRIDETATTIIEQVTKNADNFIWKNIASVDELIEIRLGAMKNFLSDYEKGNPRYVRNELPSLSFENNSFDLVLSSHFLFLYSEHFDLQFHVDSIHEMLRVSKKEIRIFPLLDLKNNESKHLNGVLDMLNEKNYKFEIVKTDYEFQKNANKMLRIMV